MIAVPASTHTAALLLLLPRTTALCRCYCSLVLLPSHSAAPSGRAIALYRVAAEQGEARAQRNLGNLHWPVCAAVRTAVRAILLLYVLLCVLM